MESTNQLEIVTENMACFELDSSEVYLDLDKPYGFAKKIDGDDDDDIIILEDEKGILFDGEIELFGKDVLSKDKYIEYRRYV